MAARLLRIKAQMLLPRRGDDEEWEDPRAELVRRLLEYQQMREVVDVLERRGEERRNQFSRAYLPQAPAAPSATLALSLAELLSAVDRVLRAVRQTAEHSRRSRAAGDRQSRRDQRHSIGARTAGTHPVDRYRRTHGRTLADSLDCCSACSSSRSSAKSK